MHKKTAGRRIAKRAALRWRALTAHVQHKATRSYKLIVANSGFQHKRNACVHTNVGITKLRYALSAIATIAASSARTMSSRLIHGVVAGLSSTWLAINGT